VTCLPEVVQNPKRFEVWPEHEDAVHLFLQCQTQWRVGGSGVVGLDYGAVAFLMDLYAVGNRRQALEDLQIMESRAKELINKAAEPKQPKGRRR
jgi:ABC-type thiamine transport system substrate-binding protein